MVFGFNKTAAIVVLCGGAMKEQHKHGKIGIDGYKWCYGNRTSIGRKANKRYFRRVRRMEYKKWED